MSLGLDSDNMVCGCCCQRTIQRHHRVQPDAGEFPDYTIYEVRPERLLRVQHFNQSPRAIHFKQEYCEYLERIHENDKLFDQQKQVRKNLSSDAEYSEADHSAIVNNEILIQQLEDLKDKPNGVSHLPGKQLPSNQINTGDATIFFIHGVGGSSSVWAAQTDYLATQGFELVVPDLIGHGFSGTPKHPKAYTFLEIAQDLLVLFDKFCKRQNVIIGHSYGCSFAAYLARLRGPWVTKLVLISGGSPVPLAPQPGIFSLPLCLLSCCNPLLARGFKKSAFSSEVLDGAFDVPTYVLKNTMNGQLWLEGDVSFHALIAAPTLIIHGQDDKFVSTEEDQEMNKVIYGSRLEVLENASHMVMMEQPKLVNQLIHNFLQKDIHWLTQNKNVENSPQQHSISKNQISGNPLPAIASSSKLSKTRSCQSSQYGKFGSTVSLKSNKSIPGNFIHK